MRPPVKDPEQSGQFPLRNSSGNIEPGIAGETDSNSAQLAVPGRYESAKTLRAIAAIAYQLQT